MWSRNTGKSVSSAETCKNGKGSDECRISARADTQKREIRWQWWTADASVCTDTENRVRVQMQVTEIREVHGKCIDQGCCQAEAFLVFSTAKSIDGHSTWVSVGGGSEPEATEVCKKGFSCIATHSLNSSRFSTGADAYFAVTSHWIQESTPGSWEVQSALFGFTQLNNAHNGK
ncbi:hypothetical protein JB92DRAFT_2833509 [Gautieria morchelliformis]|nr:hypothetical protein JB92DRAFT_2833509 [Gautieria morchelliformis]